MENLESFGQSSNGAVGILLNSLGIPWNPLVGLVRNQNPGQDSDSRNLLESNQLCLAAMNKEFSVLFTYHILWVPWPF